MFIMAAMFWAKAITWQTMEDLSLVPTGEEDQSEMVVDRLSDLPWGIFNNIYQNMSIIDAIRLSVLARDWRHRWLSLSHFHLDVHDIGHFLRTRNIRWDIAASIINKYLSQHTSQIRTFSLRLFCANHYSDLYFWFQCLAQKNIEDLLIINYSRERFILPSYLFSFQNLVGLALSNCSLQIPPSFIRYNLVLRISLTDVTISETDLDYLISACPLLEKLNLFNIQQLQHLRIRAPRVISLKVDSRFESFTIAAPSLIEIVISDSFRGTWVGLFPNWSNLSNGLRGVDSLLSLSLYGDLLKLIAIGFENQAFPFMNTSLTSLSLHRVRFDNVQVFMVCLSLLCCCPNITDFFFSIFSAKGPTLIKTFLKETQERALTFPKLKSLEVLCLERVGMGATIKFIEFIITASPNLKRVTIAREGPLVMNPKRITQMISRFRKRCPHATVNYVYEGQVVHL
ncbi:F-box/FBD/LRR-repeat protein At2g04230-like isoform X1 [Amaranthus tricolor]|uniref:F-box/FBD/LRR-repeat protein At2g04230-like isoform X1 n=1 Tax=Amaranthus tricolor TaxID=29722 RepID=UPI002589D77A|nr:F-box/FBD/LRR-repeat protein At2g04230-like isoform X1 [Amaranthus tricolor]